jgi:hypothetical protein
MLLHGGRDIRLQHYQSTTLPIQLASCQYTTTQSGIEQQKQQRQSYKKCICH